MWIKTLTSGIVHFVMLHWTILLLVGLISGLYYYYFMRVFQHFDKHKKGTHYIQPAILFGNEFLTNVAKTSLVDFTVDLYNRFKGLPYVGYFEGSIPVFMVFDTHIIKTITMTEFDSFSSKAMYILNAPSYARKLISYLPGQKWKTVRGMISPTFSGAKLRAMENMVQECAQQMLDVLRKRKDGDKEVNIKTLINRYTLQAIGCCGFGINVKSLKDENSEFMRTASKFEEISIIEKGIFVTVFMLFPFLLSYIPIFWFNRKTLDYLKDAVDQVKRRRKNNPEERRVDLMQIMLDAAEKEKEKDPKYRFMDDDTITSQALFFLVAGFDTSGSMMSLTCALLAQHQDIQDQLREQINEAVEKYTDISIYDLVNKVPFLEQVMLESVRMYPPSPRIERVCTKPFTIPGTEVKFNPGDCIIIPLRSLMQDPELFPEPDKFNPYRFAGEKRHFSKTLDLYLMPFGIGPRICLGMRFALYAGKLILFQLLREYKINPSPKTQIPFVLEKTSIFVKPKGGIFVELEPLEHKK